MGIDISQATEEQLEAALWEKRNKRRAEEEKQKRKLFEDIWTALKSKGELIHEDLSNLDLDGDLYDWSIDVTYQHSGVSTVSINFEVKDRAFN